MKALRVVAGDRVLPLAFSFIVLLPAGTTGVAAQQAPDLPEWHRAHARDLPDYVFAHGTPQAPAAPGRVDVAAFASESFIIEQLHVRARFERDGTGRIERTVRVRVQNEEGVRGWGQLVVPYNTASERLDIENAAVLKADGSTVPIGVGAIQDLPMPVQRDAPAYSDYRQRHIAVPSLRPGDVVSFREVRTIVQPLVPGHFWYEQEVVREAIVLDEQIWLDLPADRDVTVKARTGIEDMTREHAAEAGPGRRLRVWRTANLTIPDRGTKKDKDKDKADAAGKDKKEESESQTETGPTFPAIQLTTFKSWDEVAAWYAGLAGPMAEPDATVKAKAEALTRDKTTPADKLQALYEFVAHDVRYVSLSFGIGRLQPHAAADALRNQYGDCKDKHTLFAALARAVGLTVDPVLIGSGRPLDPDVPSPAQFDHLISVVRDPAVVKDAADRAQWVWLDTTPGVAPYRAILPVLYGKTALIAASSAAGRDASNTGRSPFLVDLPKLPAIPHDEQDTITGSISEDGKLDARLESSLHGDGELALRLLFSSIPRAQWPAVGEEFAKQSWIGGTSSDFVLSEPDALREPFRIAYRLERANYIAREKPEYRMPLPLSRLPLVATEASDWNTAKPVAIGGPTSITRRVTLQMPASFDVRAPADVDITRGYGRYRATYSVKDHTISAERTFVLSVAELDPSSSADFLAFVRALRADEEQRFTLTMPAKAKETPTELPASTKVQELHDSAGKAFEAHRYTEALALYKRVVEQEPKHPDDWNNMGRALMELRRLDDAIEAFNTQIAIDPFDEYAYNNRGLAQMRKGLKTEAEASFRKQLEVNPLDKYAHRNLGGLLVDRGDYAAALPEIEKAVAITPDEAWLRTRLGRLYLEAKRPDDARAAFEKAVSMSATPPIWNDIAWAMVLHDVDLPRAQAYAESAVGAAAAQLRQLTLNGLTVPQLGAVAGISAFWDTLGWIMFRRGDLVGAEKYLHAAWVLFPRPELAEHVGALYEKQGKTRAAMDVYAEALSMDRNHAKAKARLTALAAGKANVETLISTAAQTAVSRRTIELPIPADRRPPRGPTADVLVLLDSSSPSAEVKFVRGDAAFAPLLPALKSAKYPVEWPSAAPTRVVRRGIIGCGATGTCTLVLMLPGDVRSVD